MNDQGYIMIPRSIFHTWLWDNPIYYQWYSDLYGLAAFKDRSTLVGRKIVRLRRGQLVGSIQFFVSRWGRSKTMILNFLDLLQSDGYIIKESSHNISIITIVHYYASNTFVQMKEDNLCQDLFYSDSANYRNNDDNPKNNRKYNNEDNLNDNLGDNSEYSLGDNNVDMVEDSIEKKNEEKENYEKKEIKKERICLSSSTTPACEEKEFFEELVVNDNWKNTIASRFLIETSSIPSFLELFRQDQEARGRTKGHTDIQDFKSHFCDWLRKELDHRSRRTPKGNKKTAASPTPSLVQEKEESAIKERIFKIVGMKLYQMYFKTMTITTREGVIVFSSPYSECGDRIKEWKSRFESILQMKVEFILEP